MIHHPRTIAVTTLLILAVLIGTAGYLRAQAQDPEKAAAMRRAQNAIPTKPTRPAAGSQIPTAQELAVGERHGPFSNRLLTMPIMNSELTNTINENGWRGAGRLTNPIMGLPSYTVPAGGFDSPLWTSACALYAYLPSVASSYSLPFAEGAFVGTGNVYRIPPHTNLEPPTGFWSDLGGAGSAGFARGTAGPGGYREPFVTEVAFYNNVGVNIKQQSYSFSYGYDHTNDFILMRYALTNTGNVDADAWVHSPSDFIYDATGAAMRNLAMTLRHDFDLTTALDPFANNFTENGSGDDMSPGAFFEKITPKAIPVYLPGSGRHDRLPFGPRLYSGLSSMFDGDNPGVHGIDTNVWPDLQKTFNPLHVGAASLLILEGAGAGPLGDLAAPIKTTVWGGPSVGLFQTGNWHLTDNNGVVNWYRTILSSYLTSFPGDLPVAGGPNQPQNLSPNPDFFVSGVPLDKDTDVGTWVPKPEVAPLTAAYGDPRRSGTFSGGTSAPHTNPPGRYNNITLYDLDGPFQPIVPDPYKGADRKEITSIASDLKVALGWGPFDLDVGESLSIWQVDLVGAGMDGIYDVYLRAQDVWMQRKYNPANDTYYWDGSNDRVIPTYDVNGAVTGTQTVNPGRDAGSGAVFLPPPAVTDVSDPLSAAVEGSHPYARFIHEGSTISADYNIGGVYDFITRENYTTFSAPAFAGPYIQVAEFVPDGSSRLPNVFDPPERITVPNPLPETDRFPGFTDDAVSTIPSSRRIVDANTGLGSTEAFALTFPATVFDNELDGALKGIAVDPRLAGKTGYLFEDRTPSIGFDYWYYVASVDNESAVHRDFDNFIQDDVGSSQTVIERTIQGLESFYTMNANGTDGLWHGQFPFRGSTVGPEVPGQAITPTVPPRNEVTAQGPEFLALVTVAPNPFVFQAAWDKGSVAQQTVRFFNLPVPCKIRIFDVSGLPINEFDVPGPYTQTLGGVTDWNLLSRNDVAVAAGLYIILIEAELQGRVYTKTLKLYIRR